MTTLAITRRPVVFQTGVSAVTLAGLLSKKEAAIASASRYGFTDPLAASAFIADSIEANFAAGSYRQGYVASDQLTMLPGWAFSRTGAGTAETAGGGVQNFATATPRLTDRGLLMESAATNLATFSMALENAAWAKSGTAAVTANTGVAPDGTTTADRLLIGPALGQVQKSTPGLTAAAPMTVSMWARGTGTLGLRSGVSGQSTTRVLTSAWQRIIWTVNAAAVTELIQLGNSGLVPAASADIDAQIWGFQVETGNRASSFIPTTSAAATRGADAASFTVASGAEGGVFFDVELPPVLPTSAQVLLSWAGPVGTRLAIYRVDGGQIVVGLNKPDGAIILATPGFGGQRRVKGFVGWGGGQLVRTIDGVNLPDTPYPLTAGLTTVRPGAETNGSEMLNGNIRRLLFTKRLPTPAQRVAMTGG